MPSLSAGLFRRWRALTERVRDGSDLDRSDRVEAAFVLQKLPARRVVKAMRRERLADEAVETAEQIAATARLRVAVFVGNEGRCAVHGEALGNDWHMHHIEQGGLRKQRQSIRNCAPVCERAHEVELHRHDLDAMTALRNWCVGKGYAEAAAILARRIDKVRATRAAQRRP